MTGTVTKHAVNMRDLPELATVAQVAEAAQVSRKTIYKLIASGDLKSVRVRKCVRVNRDAACEYFGL